MNGHGSEGHAVAPTLVIDPIHRYADLFCLVRLAEAADALEAVAPTSVNRER